MKTNKEMIVEYTRIIKDLQAQKDAVEQEISERLVERTKLMLEPFKEGDKVKCELTVGKSKGIKECVIEIDKGTGRVAVRPYNKEGQLGGRKFYIDTFDNDYSKVFTK